MKVVLAEKPSVARDIARVLKITGKKKGYYEGKGCAVTWAFGHMVELQEPNKYDAAWKRWSLNTLPMIPESFHVQPRGDKSAQEQLDIIVGLFKEAEELVCATDAGREGELIFRYIQTWAECEQKPFRRLWISSLTDDAISKGFRELKDGHDFDRLYHAARCRSESDWIVGLNATRFFTVKYGRQKELWTVGRVQTPVLAMIVQRDLEIEQFNSKEYWELHTLYRKTVFKHATGKIEEREKADELLAKVQGHELTITDIKKQTRTFQPPQLFDLTELQREMNKRFGMTAKRTLQSAQKLYENKHLTYPRTDSRYLGEDMKPELAPLLERLRKIRPNEIQPLDLGKLPITKRIVDDSKVSDHHAIIPTNQLAGALQGDEAHVYEAVVRRFIAVFYPPCLKDLTTVRAESNREPFKASGTVVTDPGWQALYPHMMKESAKKKAAKKKKPEDEDEIGDQVLPAFTQGEHGPHEPLVKTLKTKPPVPFTEASLLQMMETAGKLVEEDELREALKEKGIGTPATRAAIIETLIGRSYIVRKKKQLRSTEAGRNLIRIVQDDRLKSPELTGDWEAHLKQIEQGKYDPDAFMQQVAEHTRQIISQTGTVKRAAPSLGDCPQCSEGRIIAGKKGYGCSRWKAGCKFVIWKEQLGAQLSPEQAAELLTDKKVSRPMLLQVEGAKRYGTVTLGADGTVGWKPVPAKTKINDRALMGQCPRCGSDIIEGDKGFGCTSWKTGCKFVVWKTLSHRKIPQEMVRVLLKEGITPFIQKFQNKQGKRFDARLKLEEGEVKFDFTKNEKKVVEGDKPPAEST